MRLLTLLTYLLSLTQGIALPAPTAPSNHTDIALNTTLSGWNGTLPDFVQRSKPPQNWPGNLAYYPKHESQIKLLRFRGRQCKVPKTLQHEEHLDIAPAGYEDDPEMVCKKFKKENALDSIWFQLPTKIVKQTIPGDRGAGSYYTGPLHHCRMVVYRGHFCDGQEVVSLDESDEEQCIWAHGGHSMRVACWK